MKAVFLSDSHLRKRTDPGYACLLDFFAFLRGKCERLFIVGDFFDFWFCDEKEVYPEFHDIIERLLDLQEAGTSISLFEGNHDFYMAGYFARRGLEVFPDWGEFSIEGKSILISHGDLVDRENHRYLLLRKILRSRFFFNFQKFIPCRLRWEIAALSSRASKELYDSQEELAVKLEKFALTRLATGHDAVILGHCHLPVFKQFEMGGRHKIFCSLGDWVSHYSYLTLEKGRFQLSFWDNNVK